MTVEILKKIINRNEYSSIDTEGWYSVNLESFTLDFYFRPSNTKRAWILSPGWLDRSTYPTPYFQRIKWLPSLDGVGISLADPSLSLNEEIQVGWFLGNEKCDHLRETATYLSELLDHMGIMREETIFFGSSAGGFSSLGFATYLQNTKALIVNPQLDLFHFHNIPELAKIIKHGFGSKNTTHLKLQFPWRFSIFSLFEKEHYTPPCLIMINTADDWHVSEHLVPFLARLSGHELSKNINVKFFYDKEMGHNPPGPDVMIPVMKNFSNNLALIEI